MVTENSLMITLDILYYRHCRSLAMLMSIKLSFLCVDAVSNRQNNLYLIVDNLSIGNGKPLKE